MKKFFYEIVILIVMVLFVGCSDAPHETSKSDADLQENMTIAQAKESQQIQKKTLKTEVDSFEKKPLVISRDISYVDVDVELSYAQSQAVAHLFYKGQVDFENMLQHIGLEKSGISSAFLNDYYTDLETGRTAALGADKILRDQSIVLKAGDYFELIDEINSAKGIEQIGADLYKVPLTSKLEAVENEASLYLDEFKSELKNAQEQSATSSGSLEMTDNNAIDEDFLSQFEFEDYFTIRVFNGRVTEATLFFRTSKEESFSKKITVKLTNYDSAKTLERPKGF